MRHNRKDHSVIEVARRRENTADESGDPPDVDFLDVKIEYEDESIILIPQSRRRDIDPYRIPASQETIQNLSTWIRTVTHQVLRLARTEGRKDHISFRGKTICNHKVHAGTRDPPFGIDAPSSEDDDPYRWYVPLDRLHNAALTRRGVCTDCKSELERFGFGGQQLDGYYQQPKGVPTCPKCGDDVVAFKRPDFGSPIAKHEETGDPNSPDQCELSRREIKELFASALGVQVEAKSRYSKDKPHNYIKDFPNEITDNTGGLKVEYCQPAQKSSTRMGKTPDQFAGLFELTHPQFSHICVFRYFHWGRGDVYEPALESL